MKPAKIKMPSIRDAVLEWYDAHRRRLPWRAEPGETIDPYSVWLSEIMLQQTTVATVGPYFQAFTERWPRVQDLAVASLDDVLVAWQGLGYYARARNLHKCAQVITADHGGIFPMTVPELLKLPGIGPYTSAAIAAIAFDQPAVPMDGNIERVTARLFNVVTPLPAGKGEIRTHADTFIDDHRPGDFAQAMMDLGATICVPKSPKCLACPVTVHCKATATGDPGRLPVTAPKKARPVRYAVVYWIENDNGAVLMRKRPERGLLGGMAEFPSTDWTESGFPKAETVASEAPMKADCTELPSQTEHVFTHFKLVMRIYKGRAKGRRSKDVFWVHPEDFENHALPTVMKKVVKVVTG